MATVVKETSDAETSVLQVRFSYEMNGVICIWVSERALYMIYIKIYRLRSLWKSSLKNDQTGNLTRNS